MKSSEILNLVEENKRLKAVIIAAFSFGIGQEQHKILRDEIERMKKI